MKKLILLLTILLLFLPFTYAKSGHMKLLAVSDTLDGEIGGVADLYLEIKPGTGRVFLETFPLTRVDTQISTRFAKEIACEFSKKECDNFDFFYTITANSAIIAGPSAGASITVLTVSLLEGFSLKKDVAITGTINSGGLIGFVGGIKAKIEAGKKVGMAKILIPKGKPIVQDNKTYDVENLSRQSELEIIEVSTLAVALEHFTDKKFDTEVKNISIDESYKDTMKVLAIELCSRNTKLFNRLNSSEVDLTNNSVWNLALNLSKKGKILFNQGKYYSSASYCFGANVEYSYFSIITKNFTKSEMLEKSEEVKRGINDLHNKVDVFEIQTITDLESFMVVKERLIEASDLLEELDLNDTNSNFRNLAFASERLNSAKSWSLFMDNRGKKFNLKREVIKQACMKKISEAEERFQYVQIYFPQNLENTRKELNYAYDDLNNGDFELCLFKASKAKANIGTILSVFGAELDQVDGILAEKQKIVGKNLIEQTKNGVFPILGFSYYEYSNSLAKEDKFSALLYSEYALELSNLDIYFKSDKKSTPDFNIDRKMLFVFILGLLLGGLSLKLAQLTKGNKK